MLIIIIMGITLSAHAEGVNVPVAIKCDEGVFLSYNIQKRTISQVIISKIGI